MNTLLTRYGFAKKRVIIAVVALVVLIGIVYFFVAKNNSSKYQFVSVSKGNITEVVTSLTLLSGSRISLSARL